MKDLGDSCVLRLVIIAYCLKGVMFWVAVFWNICWIGKFGMGLASKLNEACVT
jgi:hypothetical protein